MYVQSQPSATFMPPTVDTPAPTDGASGAASAHSPPPITHRALARAEGMLGALLQAKVDVLDAYTILFDVLNTGSEESFANAIRHATKNFPAPESMKGLPVSVQLKQPSPPFSRSLNHSWPQKVLMCKDGGAHVKLTLSISDTWIHSDAGINQDFKKLPAGTLHHVHFPQPTPPSERLTPTEFRNWHVKHHMDPAIEALKPNQVLLMSPPNSPALLIGRDDAGRQFGITSRGEDMVNQPRARMLDDAQLHFVLSMTRGMPTPPGNWAILQPR